MTRGLTISAKWKHAGGFALLALICCAPLWLFFGRVFLPYPSVKAGEGLPILLVLCLIIYGLLICATILIASAIGDYVRNLRVKGSEVAQD